MTEVSAPLHELVLEGALEAPLAAHISILLDAGLPLTILAIESPLRQRVADAFAATLRHASSVGHRDEIFVESDHHFEWLGDPVGIGCMDPLAGTNPRSVRSVLLRVSGLVGGLEPGCARIALRSLARGYQAIIEAQAPDLPALFDALRATPLRLPEDDLQQLGVVLRVDTTRVLAAHLLHPSVGTTRRPPTLLTNWDASAGRWDDFTWAALPAFAERSRMNQAKYDAIHQARMTILGAPASR